MSRVTPSFSRQRPRNTFCWLPPLSVSAVVARRLRSNPINPARRWASPAERPRLIIPPWLTVFSRVASRLRATDWCRNNPSLFRSLEANTAPASIDRCGAPRRMGAAGDRYVAARIRHQTSERPQDLAGARAHLTRDGDDFTAARAQSEIRKHVLVRTVGR